MAEQRRWRATPESSNSGAAQPAAPLPEDLEAFSEEHPMPRSEVACAICARLDLNERRVKLYLFAAPPPVSDAIEDDLSEESSSDETDTTASTRNRPSVWSDDVAFVQNPKRVQELLCVERYQERWPWIPRKELHASSIQHPRYPSWRWLLHSRRVPVLPNSGALQPAAEDPDRPPCAGIGDASMPVWSCRECQQDLCDPLPKLPLYAVANDLWFGTLQREQYMRPQEKWGRMPVRILCGDFFQLPPVPATAAQMMQELQVMQTDASAAGDPPPSL